MQLATKTNNTQTLATKIFTLLGILCSPIFAQPVDWSKTTSWSNANTPPSFWSFGEQYVFETIENFNGINGLNATMTSSTFGASQIGIIGAGSNLNGTPDIDMAIDDDGFDSSMSLQIQFNKPVNIVFRDMTLDESETVFLSSSGTGSLNVVQTSGFSTAPVITATGTSLNIKGSDATAQALDNVIDIEGLGITSLAYTYDSTATFPMPSNENIWRINSIKTVPESSAGLPIFCILAVLLARSRRTAI